MIADMRLMSTALTGSTGDENRIDEAELLELVDDYSGQDSAVDSYEAAAFGDLASLFSDVFQRTSLPNQFNEEYARDLINAIESMGRTKPALQRLENALDANSEAWTKPALVLLQKYLERNNITPFPTVFHRTFSDGASSKVTLPSVDDLLSGRIEKFAFARALKDIMKEWYGGSVEVMSKKTKLPSLDLQLFMSGSVLPVNYSDIYRIGAAIKHIAVDGLANAWIADMHRIALADEEIRDGSPLKGLSYEARRVEMLMYASALKLGQGYFALQEKHLFYSVAIGISHAVQAGFVSRTVVESFADYLSTIDGAIDDIEIEAKRFEDDRQHIFASYLLEVGAYHHAREGDLARSASMLKGAADTIESEEGYLKFVKGYAELRRIELYERALVDNAKARVLSGMSIEPDAYDAFKFDVSLKLHRLGASYSDGFLSGAVAGAVAGKNNRPSSAPATILRKKKAKQEGGSGGGSSSSGKGAVEAEFAHRSPGFSVGKDPAKKLGGIISNRDSVVLSYVDGLHPERRVAVDDFMSHSPSVWEEIIKQGRKDLVEAAMDAVSGGRQVPAVSSTAFHSALLKLAHGAGLFLGYGSSKVFPTEAKFTIEPGSTWTFGGQQLTAQKPWSNPVGK